MTDEHDDPYHTVWGDSRIRHDRPKGRSMGLFPKINVEALQKDFNDKFDQLLAKLDEILEALRARNTKR